MTIDENQFAFLYLLLDARERGEWVPLSMLRTGMHLYPADARLVAINLENAGLAECVVDDRLTGDARYKYKLTPDGLDLIRDIVCAPTGKLTHTVKRPK
jgi:hypothetical protein